MSIDRVFLSSVNAGMILAFACASALSTNASEWFQENAAGLIRTYVRTLIQKVHER